MSNQIETVHLNEGTVTFDHSTGHMQAKWNNGYIENWSNRYGLEAHRNAFYHFIEQEWRVK